MYGWASHNNELKADLAAVFVLIIKKKFVNDHLSFNNACEDSLLVHQFYCQVRVGEFVCGDCEFVISEKHP